MDEKKPTTEKKPEYFDRPIRSGNEKGIEVISRRPKSPAQHDKGAED